MTLDEILKAFDNIRVWQRGDRRAPHKPLLILMAPPLAYMSYLTYTLLDEQSG